MDRPMGPRPDQRSAAYESIFGRPSVGHHQYANAQPSSSLQPYRQQPYDVAGQGFYYQQQQQQPYPTQYDAQAAYTPSQYGQQQYPPPSAYRQSYYQPPPQQPAYPVHNNNHLSVAAQHQQQGYARSLASSSHSMGVIAPPPVEPPDPNLESLTRAGMTPAQAYQAQVYSRNPNNHHSPALAVDNPNQIFRSASESPPQQKRPQSYADTYQAPRLGIEPPDPRIELDFLDGELSGSSSTGDFPSTVTSSPPSFSPDSSPFEDQQSMAGPSSRPYPLQLDTAVHTTVPPEEAHSPSSSLYADRNSPTASVPVPASRRSSDSSRTLPRPAGLRRERTTQDRSRSMSATTSQARNMLSEIRHVSRPSMPSFRPSTSDRNSPASGISANHHQPHHSRRTPIVYPALLSRVAQAFRERITVSDRVKDGLTYKDAFDGREAVDKIAYIIKTTDRNLALLLGRALDAQKFFHDVTYDHRLRDSPYEIYQFKQQVATPFASADLAFVEDGNEGIKEENGKGGSAEGASKEALVDDGSSAQVPGPNTSGNMSSDDVPLPSGVYTLLTDCYSPTCSRNSLCYSIACPRRLEQQSRLNMKPQPGLKQRTPSKESLGDLVEPGTLWVHSVPKEIVDNVSDVEKNRQEAINEVIYTERDFVRDMEYLRDLWIGPLKTSDVIPEERRLDFLEQVFWNVHDIISVNMKLRDAFNKRQKSYAVVERIGDIFLDVVPQFAPFVSYGSHQLYGKYEFEKEKSGNPAFQKFVDEVERRPESRKLELNGYLTKPTTRLARYPLLLEVVLKYTPDDNPDKKDLPVVIQLVKDFLAKVNIESGKTENRFNLLQLDQQLVFRQGEEVDLHLTDECRELVFKGNLKRRGGTAGDSGDIQVFLFDHALLMVKQKEKNKGDQHKVYRRPIPLELLLVSAPEDTNSLRQNSKAANKTLLKSNTTAKNLPPTPPSAPAKVTNNSKDGYSLTFVHLGRKYYQITLWASTFVGRKKWLDLISKQQEVLRERSLTFDTVTLCEGFFAVGNRVNCAAPFDNGRRMAYGTNDGVYFANFRESKRPVRVLALMDVTQVEVLEGYRLLIVLSEHSVITFPLEALSENDPTAGLRRAKRISSHTSFFKAGVCLGKSLVCVVKASQLSSTIKALEPIDHADRGRNKPTFKKLIQGGNDTLRLFREFYIPVESSSIHYLKTKLCVGCTKGFEIVDLENLDTQSLLDPSDTSLDFVQKRDDVRPMAIYRIDNDFLLCYDEFAFYVNKSGWRARKHFMVYWEGHPRQFALQYPYVLAFEPTFVEVRHVETGNMVQIIQGNNLRCLFAEAPPSTTHSASAASSVTYHNHHQQQQHHQNIYGGAGGVMMMDSSRQSVYSVASSTNDRSSIVSSMSSTTLIAPGYGMPGYAPRMPPRNHIIMVSDDRIMALQLAPPPTPDTVSLRTQR